jgi:subtilisin family serine protease
VAFAGLILAIGVSLMGAQGGSAPLGKAEPDRPEKLDVELLEGTAKQPIFVRFEDQVFRKGGDFESFCSKNEKRSRTELRSEMISALKSKAGRSWSAVRGSVEDLQAKGEIANVVRFWIVNGFACDASSAASKALAGRKDVAFVYLQRGPNGFRQQLTLQPGAGIADADANEARRKATAAAIESAKKAKPADWAGAEIPWNLKRIGADHAWTQEKATGKGVVVGISDGGFSAVPALLGSIYTNPKETLDGKDDDGNGYVDDVSGYDFRNDSGLTFGGTNLFHGTMCAGIVAGRPIEGKNLVTGVAPEAKLMPLNGMGFLRVYEYALANGVDVLSMSWMWPNIELGHYRGVYRLALEHMTAGGVLSLGGAGNFAQNAPEGKQICLPKDVPCCVSVAGIQLEDRRPAFSSKGPVSWAGVKFYDDHPKLQKPDLTAPNGAFPVWSAVQGFPNPNWKVVWRGKDDDGLLEGPQGNSFAGPHAAGVAALMFSANPDINPWQVKRLMEQTCEDLGEKGWDVESGAGLIDALKAVRAAKKLQR